MVNVNKDIGPHPLWFTNLWKMAKDKRQNKSDPILHEKPKDKELVSANTLDKTPQYSEASDINRHVDKEAKQQFLQDEKIVADVHAQKLGKKNYIGYFTKDAFLDKKVVSMQSTFMSVLQLQKELKIESIFTDVKETTRKFPLLSAAVYENMKLLGKKNPTNETE